MINIFPRELGAQLVYERHRMHYEFGIKTIKGDPRAIIVGECPGARTDPMFPLWPEFPGSTGSRLLEYFDIDPKIYFERTLRVNQCQYEWDTQDAYSRTVDIAAWAFVNRTKYNFPLRVVLLGKRVMKAWYADLRRPFQYYENTFGLQVITIPHPSGLNRAYNDPENVARARRYLRWSIGC